MSLVLIHITDIHIKSSIVNNPVLNKIDAIKKACSSMVNAGDDVVFILTGDMAYSGQEVEYLQCTDFFNHIIDYLRSQSDANFHIAIVPGNHDCDFTSGDKVERDFLINSINTQHNNIPEAIVSKINSVQHEFRLFSSRYSSNIRINEIVNLQELELGCGKVLVVMYNSSWKSEKNEKYGTLYIPSNLFPIVSRDNYSLVISMIHHPFSWLYVENSHEFYSHLRTLADMHFIGHEHRHDYEMASGDNWFINKYHGNELQNSDDADDSSFSIYKLDNLLETIQTVCFKWEINESMYKREYENIGDFHKNSHVQDMILLPNVNTKRFLNDLGIIVHHFRVNNVSLQNIYCWPELQALNFKDGSITKGAKIRKDIANHISQFSLPLIIGDSLGGKTSLAKMLYATYVGQGKCCIYSSGSDFSSHNQESVWRTIENLFRAQYSDNQLERFRQLPHEDRILFIDDFEGIIFAEDKKERILTFLLSMFKTVFLLTGREADLSMLLAMKEITEKETITPIRILPMGNFKRKELITKWYLLGEDELDSFDLDDKVNSAIQIVDTIIGNNAKLIPANPIIILNTLQHISTAGSSSLTGSKYGYIYDMLIKRSLSEIARADTGLINIYVAVLSQIAYKMLNSGSMVFSLSEIIDSVDEFNKAKLLNIDYNDLLSNMLNIRILHIDRNSDYRFRYPYVFCYFAGQFIANHLEDKNVKNLISLMSENLHNEIYGNIIIFVCHFTKNIDIIDSILLKAYCLFDQIDPFDFKSPSSILELTNETIEKYLVLKSVGEESDIETQKNRALIRKDDAGIQDGTISEFKSDRIQDLAEQEKKIADVVCAIKVIDVLGQILRNYPGDIDRDKKIEMLTEIHNLGMRIIKVFMDAFGYVDKDLVTYLADIVKKELKKDRATPKIDSETIYTIKSMFSFFLASLARGIISKIAFSVGTEQLLPATQEVYNASDLVSGRLILIDIKLNHLNMRSADEVISLYTNLREKNYIFAAVILRSIVSSYLVYNRCGNVVRDKLCSSFELDKTQYLIASDTDI